MARTLGVAAFEYDLPREELFSAVRRLGVAHCELATPKNVTPADAEMVAESAAKNGVSVTAVASLSKLNAADDVEAHQKLINDSILCASVLKAPYVITYFGGHPERPEREAIQRYRDLIQPCLDLAERHGVVILIENHFSHAPGEVTNSADGCLELLETIDSPFFKLNFDPCNFAIGGEEYWPYAYRLLKPHIRNVHMKDAIKYDPRIHGTYHGRIVTDLRRGDHIFVPLGKGAVYNEAVLRQLVEDGYDGPITIEAHTPEETLNEVFKVGIQYCRERGI